MKNFRPKIVEISNFELQKRYVPQKKAENMWNSDSGRKSRIFLEKMDFFRFLRILRQNFRGLSVFEAKFFKNLKKKSEKWLC